MIDFDLVTEKCLQETIIEDDDDANATKLIKTREEEDFRPRKYSF